ncbi:DUF2157 domain-containing protein [Aquabacterium sp.]|uniref:DUF2157 domain-containing protein n=1 Tax=Aquabacterium sp. TaxID=1872578 RepID=UPI0035AF2341
MDIKRPQLDEAVRRGLLSDSQATQLWAFLSEQGQNTPSFRMTHILYYLGGMIAIGAMTLFMNLGWESFGGGGLLVISLLYAVAGLGLTEHLLKARHLPIPAGITATFVVVLTPLAVYGLQVMMGWWADGRVYRDYHVFIDWRWLMMELATLAVAALMLWRYRLAFLVMPVAVTLWYMSMDLVPYLFGYNQVDWATRQFVSLWFGLLMTLLAFWVDVRTRHATQDFPFWLYLFGVLTFWGALSSMNSDSEWSKLGYCAINLLMIGIGALLSRRVFAVFGGLGVAAYLGHLAATVFKDSLLFPLALTAIGLGVVYVGILWQRHEARITARLRASLPAVLSEMLANRD